MNSPTKTILCTGVILLIAALCCYFFLPTNPPPIPVLSSVETKMQAYDHFFMQRAYPESAIDLETYFQTMQGLQHRVQHRNQPAGFDGDWQLEGPGNLGARVNTIAVHPFDEQIIYAGFSTGGLYKTTNGGQDWTPIFDEQAYLSIGHITIDPTFPDVIYVGTGDPNISGYPFIGNGLYRSPDGGATWQHLGLEQQRIISKVIVDPSNFNNLYVATMGLPFERNANRGLYRSRDAGQSWEQSLYISDSTGIIDMLINPNNPDVLYASSWDRIRNNQESIAYGFGAGIYKTIDGGDNWTQLGGGLPTGKFSRVNLAMSHINPNHIFAIYVDTTYQVHAIYKSMDAGGTWARITQGGPGTQLANALGGQGWYNSKIRVHPNNDNTIYLLGVDLWRTTSGGTVWTRVVAPPGTIQPHVDNHDLVFTLNQNIILGTDGGLYRQDAGQSVWLDIDNIPTTQFYRVGYNPFRPNLFYGGAQDNGISSGSAADPDNWDLIMGGDGFRTLFREDDLRRHYIQFQFGRIFSTSNAGVTYQLATFGISPSEDRNWDAPVILSQHDTGRVYTATDRVYSAVDPSTLAPWSAISPPLTGASAIPGRFKTVSALAESPVQSGLLYAGTSDGQVWRSEDAGGSWSLINTGLPDRYVSSITASPDLADFVYVTFSGYRDNDNTALVYRSWDRGDSWFPLNGDLPDLAVNDLLVAPNNLDLVLFAATDGGVYATLDEGSSWHRLGGNMPIVPVYDLELNVEQERVIAGTFGRSIFSFSLDSIGVSIDAPSLANYAGSVKTLAGEGINNVTINYRGGANIQSIPAESNGDFSINNVPYSPDCRIRPVNNTNPTNGLTTFDIVLIQKHILAVDTLDSPYKIIAADANGSNSVTTFDVVLLRKLILQVDTAFAQNSSWRFIPSNYIFPNPEDPFEEDFPEIYECAGNQSGDNNVFFTGVKVGDVNQSANPANFNEIQTRGGKDLVIRLREDLDMKALERYQLHFYADNFEEMVGCQFTFDFDKERIKIIRELAPEGLAVNFDNFNWALREFGALPFSWSNATPNSVSSDQPLFSFEIRAAVDGKLSEALAISSRYVLAEAYNEAGEIFDVTLEYGLLTSTTASPSSTAFVAPPQPNPFREQTIINFRTTQSTDGVLEVRNVQGILLRRERRSVVPGENYFRISGDDLEAAGIYYYTLRLHNETFTGKMLYLGH
ncbi:MAG: hypothetical protein AAGG75_05780 [Bacteroidota bacterium]